MTEAKEAQNVGADGMWPLPVVIAAGGKGTRLRPFTNSIPKELVEVNGTPIIDRIIAQFRARGCEEFWATMDYHAEKLEEHFENVDPGHQVRLVNANGHRGTGGTRGTAASSKSTVPNTGDAFPLGLLGTALVAAGAATAAYERRRAENDGNRADR